MTMGEQAAARLLVVRNDATDPVLLLGEWWREVGVEVVELDADAGDPVPTRLPLSLIHI